MKSGMILLMLLGLIALFTGGCTNATLPPPGPSTRPAAGVDAPLVGTQCTVYLRGDMLGSAVKPDQITAQENLAKIQGTLTRIDSEWVVVTFGGEDSWIPRDYVFYIKARK